MSKGKIKKSKASESYFIGDVSANAKIQQGKHLTMIEQTFSDNPYKEDLIEQFQLLFKKIAEHPDLDDDIREIAHEKTQNIAESLSNAKKEPSNFKKSLLDAKVWFGSVAKWAWSEINEILKSEGAQKTISTITEAGIRGAIQSLLV